MNNNLKKSNAGRGNIQCEGVKVSVSGVFRDRRGPMWLRHGE